VRLDRTALSKVVWLADLDGRLSRSLGPFGPARSRSHLFTRILRHPTIPRIDPITKHSPHPYCHTEPKETERQLLSTAAAGSKIENTRVPVTKRTIEEIIPNPWAAGWSWRLPGYLRSARFCLRDSSRCVLPRGLWCWQTIVAGKVCSRKHPSAATTRSNRVSGIRCRPQLIRASLSRKNFTQPGTCDSLRLCSKSGPLNPYLCSKER
jgi:hypothetical protein